MKRNTLLAIATAAIVAIPMGTAVQAEARGGEELHRYRKVAPQLTPTPVGRGRVAVDVWTRPGEGAVLYPGQSVDIFFETNRSAYVVLYNVDTRGRVRKLFPTDPWDDGFVRGGEVVSVPGRHADYRLTVSGPPGIERVVALASKKPLKRVWREVAEDDFAYGAGHARRGGIFRGSYDDGTVSGRVVIRTGPADDKPGYRFTDGPRKLRPQLVPTPRSREYAKVARSETWFEVAGRRGCRY